MLAAVSPGRFGAERVILGTRRKHLPWTERGWGIGCLLCMAGSGQAHKGDDISTPGKGTQICAVGEETHSH